MNSLFPFFTPRWPPRHLGWLALSGPGLGLALAAGQPAVAQRVNSSAPDPTAATKLSGTPFGTSPAYAAGSEYGQAFDGDANTYFNFASANGAYTGLDLGAGHAAQVTKLRYYPRTGSTDEPRCTCATDEASW